MMRPNCVVKMAKLPCRKRDRRVLSSLTRRPRESGHDEKKGRVPSVKFAPETAPASHGDGLRCDHSQGPRQRFRGQFSPILLPKWQGTQDGRGQSYSAIL